MNVESKRYQMLLDQDIMASEGPELVKMKADIE